MDTKADATDSRTAPTNEAIRAIEAFLEKWALVEPRINGLFSLNFARSGVQYDGPSLADELNQLRAVVAGLPAAGRGNDAPTPDVAERAADHHDQPRDHIQALEEEIARLKACLADHAIQCPQCHVAILATLEGRA